MNNIIQKVSALALALVATIGAYAQYPALTFSDIDIAPGEEQTVSIYLADSPEDETVNLQVDVYLPKGFKFVPQSQGKGDRCLTSHQAMMSGVATASDGREWATLGVINGSARALKADNTLSVMTFKITAPDADNMPLITSIDGENIITAGNVNSYKGTRINPYTATGTITNSQVPRPTMTFEGLDTLKLKEGETRTINLDATWGSEFNITAAQGEIILPQGLSFVPNDEGDIVSFNQARLADHTSTQNLKGQRAIWMIGSMTSKIIEPGTADAPQFGSFTVKADKAFAGDSIIRATYHFATTEALTAADAADSLVVTVSGGAGPKIAFGTETIALTEGIDSTLALKVTVPEGASYKSAKAVVTLPESLSFPEGTDGTFNLDAFDADQTINIPVIPGKAVEEAGNITVVLNAIDANGIELDPSTATAAVTIAAPQAPEFAFAEADSIALEEGTEAQIVVNLTIPEGTELSSIAGTVTLPAGVSFSTQAPGIQLENGTVNTNGNTATWTATPTETGALLTINIHTNPNFKDGVVKVEATATSKAGTTFDKVTIERKIGNKTAAGINDIKAVTEKTVDGAVYNLNGQRVSKNYKGIVIVNGKKYIAK